MDMVNVGGGESFIVLNRDRTWGHQVGGGWQNG